MRRKALVQDPGGWYTFTARPRKVKAAPPAVRNVRGRRRSVRKGKAFSSVLCLFPLPASRQNLLPPNCTSTFPPLPQPPLSPSSVLSEPPPHSLSLQINSPLAEPLSLPPNSPPLSSFLSFKSALLSPPPLHISSNHPMASFRGKRPRSGPPTDSSTNLAPDPLNPSWHRRCFNCSQPGHTRANCPAKGTICTRCSKPGHDARSCKKIVKDKVTVVPKDLVDNLQPKGFVGDKDFPVGRPESVEAYIPQDPTSIRELQHLSSAVVVDTRLRSNLNHEAVQATVMTVCRFEQPPHLIHSSDQRYILLLPRGWDRARFIRTFSPQLELLGFVVYPWSARIDAAPCDYPFKVWLDLYKVPIHAWNRSHLVPLVSQFGLLLDHTPLERVWSLNTLRVVMAVRSLLDIPKKVLLIVKGLIWEVNIKVAGWAHEPTVIRLPNDPTPSIQYFQQVKEKLSMSFNQMKEAQPDANLVPVDFDVLFDVWSNMPQSEERDKLEIKLKNSIFWEIRKNKHLLREICASPPLAKNDKNQLEKVRDPTCLEPTEQIPIEDPSTGRIQTKANTDNPSIGLAGGKSSYGLVDLNEGHNSAHNDGLQGLMISGIDPVSLNPPGTYSNIPLSEQAKTMREEQERAKKGKQPVSSETPVLASGKQPLTSLNAQASLSSNFDADLTHVSSLICVPASTHINQLISEPNKVKTQVKIDRSRQSPQPVSLRRSARLPKLKKNYSHFVSGTKNNKAKSVTAAGKKAIEEALAAAGLARCLDANKFASEPTQSDEESQIKDVCGVISEAAQQPQPNDLSVVGLDDGLNLDDVGLDGLEEGEADHQN